MKDLEITLEANSPEASEALKLKFCEVLYYHTFNKLVKDINQKISSKESISNYISLVDIPGSQQFNSNYFDQFCVNFSNDQLTYLNNDVFFKKEQEIYVKERIDWKYIDFGVNEKYYEDQSKFMEEIETNSKVTIQKRVNNMNEFEILHSTGTVKYQFNNSWFNSNVIQFISNIKSENLVIDKILNDMNYKIIVTKEIKKKLSDLWSIMQSTRLQKVLCFIPNEIQKPGIIEPRLLFKQVELNNILQTIKMTRKGYIDHFSHSNFVKRYFMLAPSEFLEEEDELDAQCKLILRDCGFLNTKQYKLGKNSVLLRYSQIYILEELRAEKIFETIIQLQSIARMTLAKKELEKLKIKNEMEKEEKLLERMDTVKMVPSSNSTSKKQTLSSIMNALKTGKGQPEDFDDIPTNPNASFRMKSATIKGGKLAPEKEKKNVVNDSQFQALQEQYDRTRKINAKK
jgi:myosin heavy chain 9/10/11/14